MRFDTSALMRKIIRTAKIPAGSSYRDPATLLDIASDEMEQWLVPELLKVSGGHLLAFKDFALVAGKTRYRFPERAIRPERLEIVNAQGLLVGHLHLASGRLVDEVLSGRCPPNQGLGWWCPENNSAVVVLRSTSTVAGNTLRIFYRRQPNRLIATDKCWRIDTVYDANAAELSTINPEDVSHSPDEGDTCDVIKGTPLFECPVEDGVLATVDYPDVGFTLAVLGGAVVGDFLAPAGYTPVPQLPVAMFGALVAHTAAAILMEQGNKNASDAQRGVAATKTENALTTATPRSDEPETSSDDAWD